MLPKGLEVGTRASSNRSLYGAPTATRSGRMSSVAGRGAASPGCPGWRQGRSGPRAQELPRSARSSAGTEAPEEAPAEAPAPAFPAGPSSSAKPRPLPLPRQRIRLAQLPASGAGPVRALLAGAT